MKKQKKVVFKALHAIQLHIVPVIPVAIFYLGRHMRQSSSIYRRIIMVFSPVGFFGICKKLLSTRHTTTKTDTCSPPEQT